MKYVCLIFILNIGFSSDSGLFIRLKSQINFKSEQFLANQNNSLFFSDIETIYTRSYLELDIPLDKSLKYNNPAGKISISELTVPAYIYKSKKIAHSLEKDIALLFVHGGGCNITTDYRRMSTNLRDDLKSLIKNIPGMSIIKIHYKEFLSSSVNFFERNDECKLRTRAFLNYIKDAVRTLSKDYSNIFVYGYSFGAYLVNLLVSDKEFSNFVTGVISGAGAWDLDKIDEGYSLYFSDKLNATIYKDKKGEGNYFYLKDEKKVFIENCDNCIEFRGGINFAKGEAEGNSIYPPSDNEFNPMIKIKNQGVHTSTIAFHADTDFQIYWKEHIWLKNKLSEIHGGEKISQFLLKGAGHFIDTPGYPLGKLTTKIESFILSRLDSGM